MSCHPGWAFKSGKTRQVHYTTPCANTYLKMLMRKVCRVPLFEVTKCMHACISNVKSRHFESCYVLFCFSFLH